MKKTFATVLLAMTISMAWGQKTIISPTVHERLDRGVVALPAHQLATSR